MGLRWEKLLEFTRGEVREESREIARLKRKSSLGEADVEEVLELAELYLRKRNSPKAEICLRDVIVHDEADEEEILEACNMFERMGKYNLALEGYRRIDGMGDCEALPLYRMGRLLELQGRFDEAVRFHMKAMEREPDNPECYYRLGVAYTKSRRYTEAEKMYRQAIATDPTSRSSG
jgi:tetratricopeptide (TPR) repeat protein